MCDLMQNCEVAISSASSIAFEILANKMVWLGGYYVDNQKMIYEGFKKNNVILDLGNLRQNLESKIVPLLESKIPTYIQIIDGHSDKRFLNLFSVL